MCDDGCNTRSSASRADQVDGGPHSLCGRCAGTRALAELSRLGTALGGQPETFQGLSGIGDLMVTCFSQHSRNRLVGERLGKGERLSDIVASMQMVAEGVPTTYSAFECARRLGVETPIIDQVRALLDGTLTAREALDQLLSREPRSESIC